MSTRLLPGVSRWSRAAICLGLMGSLVAACSVLLDHDGNQCNTDADCASIAGHPTCIDHACGGAALGPDGCFYGTPSTPEQFANQCTTAQTAAFDNCKRLNLCSAGDKVADPINPPTIDGGGGPTVDAPDQSGQAMCFDAGNRAATLVIGGSTAVQNLMPGLAKILANGQTKYALAYQPSGSCTGVDNIFNAAKQTVKDIPGKQALLYHADGTSEPCTFGASGTMLDVAVSDVFSTSCNASYTGQATIAEYLGPVQPMTFVIPAGAAQATTVISAELAHYVFGRATDPLAMPYDDPTLHFVRNAGSGTQQMISRAIEIDAAHWWGTDSGSSGKVRDTLESVASTKVDSAIGILSTDVTDPARAQLRVLAFQGKSQLAGFWPDSRPELRDKRNVRDGHYNIWGPIHFFTRVTNGVPSSTAGALVNNFTLPRLPSDLLQAITDIGFVPPCAMKVQRKAEMGDITAFEPGYECGCYFETRTAGGSTPKDLSCTPCVSGTDCPAAKPACNEGFCEVQ